MPNEVSSITLGGVALQLRPGDVHGWTLSAGVKPSVRFFEVSKPLADMIEARGQRQNPAEGRTYSRKVKSGPLELVIKHAGGETVKVKGLYLTGVFPGSDKNVRRIRVADGRWWWPQTPVERAYNVRRHSGDRRLLRDRLTPVQVAQNVPDYTYRRTSMKDGKTPWTAEEVLKDILTAIAPKHRVEGFSLSDPIEELRIRDPGDQALKRALTHIPGAMVTMDPDGVPRVFNSLDRSEIQQAERIESSRFFYGGEWRKTDLSLVRPKTVTTLFDKEVEVRFDFDTQQTDTYVPGREEPVMDNVVAVTDPALQFNGKTYTWGTYLKFADWFTALAADTANQPPGNLLPLTDDILRKFFLGGYGILQANYSALNGGAPNPVWTRRVGAAQEHWRRTFRILPQWMDKIRGLKAYRVAILDEENGARARAAAYCDHTIKPSNRSLMKDNKAGWEISGYAADLTNANISPFLVTVEDEDIGIISVTPKVDPFGVGAAVCPGHIDGPVPSLTAGETAALWISKGVKLEASWKLAVVLTCVPDAPNSEARMQRLEATPGDAENKLPKSFGPIGSTKGPPVGVFTSARTARFAWLDSKASEIKESFWSGADLPEDLWVNRVECYEIAKAQAARWYAQLIDRGRGQLTTSLDPRVKITGNCLEVTHALTGAGVAQTTAVMPKPSVSLSVWSLLPEGVRRRLLRLVQL